MKVYVLIGMALAAAFSALAIPSGSSPIVIWCCLIIFYGLIVHSALRPSVFRSGLRSFVKPDLLFLIFSYILFYLPYQLASFGGYALAYSHYLTHTFVEQTNISILACTSGMLAFCAGYEYNDRSALRRSKIVVVDNRDYVDWVIVSTIVAFLLLLVLYVSTGAMAVMSSGMYNGSSADSRVGDGVYGLLTMTAMMLLPSALFRRWRYGRIGATGICASSTAALWALWLLVLGDRNNFLLVALSGGCVAAALTIRIRRLTLAVSLLVALAGYNIVEVARTSSGRSLGALAASLSSYNDSGYSDSSFTGTTIGCRASFANVPTDYSYHYGWFKLVGFAGVVPFSRGLFPEPHDGFYTSADMINTGVLGDNASWSIGTNVISDIYVDFGMLGVPALMLLVGFVAGRIVTAASETCNFDSVILFGVASPLFAELPRYSYDFPVRMIVWTAVIAILQRAIWRHFFRR